MRSTLIKKLLSYLESVKPCSLLRDLTVGSKKKHHVHKTNQGEGTYEADVRQGSSPAYESPLLAGFAVDDLFRGKLA